MTSTSLPQISLPGGMTWRRPSPADADAVLALVTSYNVPLVGHADYTLDDARDQLSDPDFDPDHDGWMVHDGSGTLVGYGWVEGDGTDEQVWLDVVCAHDEVADWLLDRVLERAAEISVAGGHERAVVRHGSYREDVRHQGRLAARGFRPATMFNRMRIDHDGPVAAPEPIPGLVVRRDGDDESLRQVAHRVITDAFREHFAFVEMTADKWIASWDAKSTFQWSQVFLAELDGEPAGVLMSTDQFVEDDKCGYVAELGVLDTARGRGIAKHLLRHAFAVDSAAGLAGTILHVDTNNTTPALGLYESVGMRSVQVIDAFELTLDTRTAG